MSHSKNKTTINNKTNEEEKRPPGRPPGKKTENKQKKEGIVNEPDKAPPSKGKIIFQMTYQEPTIFKSLFNIYKKYNSSQIDFYFGKEKSYICSKDHNKTVVIFCELYGKNMNKYYCEEPITMSFSAITLFKTFDGIPTIYDNINFVVFDKSKQSKLTIIFKNEDQLSQYDINILSTKCEMITEESIKEYSEKEKDYPINFTVNLKEMKPKISELTHISKVIGIEQSIYQKDNKIQKQITFTCKSDDKRISNRSEFLNKNCFNLNSTFDDPFFYVPISIKNIKPFVISLTKNKGIFYLKSDSDLVIKSLLGVEFNTQKKEIPGSEICYIKIISKIVKTDDDIDD